MNAPLLHAVVIEPLGLEELAPLLECRSYGLLPLANRPLLAGLLARLADAGIQDVDLYLAGHPEMTRALVGSGEAWGLKVRCHSVGDTRRLWQKPSRCLGGEGDTLILGMELDIDVAELLERLAAQPGSVRLTDGRGESLPAMRLSAGSADTPAELPWAGSTPDRIVTAKALWAANLRRLDRLHATHHVETRIHADLYLGPGCRLHDSVQLADTALIGAESVLARHVSIEARSLVGARCYIDEHAEIADCLILEGSYVGPHAYLHGKIVDQFRMLDIESGVTAYIDDARLLGSSAEVVDGKMLAKRGYEWALSFFVLVSSLPVLAAWSMLRWLHGRPVLEREVMYLPTRRALDGRQLYRELQLFSLAGVRHEARRRLPWLLGVLGRQLHLVGAALPLHKPRPDLDGIGRIYGMLQWRQVENGDTGTALAEADYLPNAGFGFSLRVLWGWIVQMIKSDKQGARP